VAKALRERANELFTSPPEIMSVDVVAHKP
jgi:hypothetical protein